MPGIAAIVCWGEMPEGERAERIGRMRSPRARAEIDTGRVRMAAYAIAAGDAAPSGAVFHDKERGLAVVADARIDNRGEVLQALGFSANDEMGVARLLALGWERWEDGLPLRLVGDFAFVVWIERERELRVIRDPFGVRPLFVIEGGNTMFLASEPDRLLAGAGEAHTPDKSAIYGYLTENPASLSCSVYSRVRRPRPGRVGTSDSLGHSSSMTLMEIRWWKPPAEARRFERRKELVEEFRSRLRAAVDARLDQAGPVVAELSGGLDSPAIAASAERLYAARAEERGGFSLISGVCPGLACDETRWIDLAAAATRFPSLRWDAKQSQWRGAPLAAINYPQAEPQFGGYAGFYKLLDEKAARVILSGVGGDQLLFDRPAIADLLRRGRLWRFRSEVGAWKDWSPVASEYVKREAMRLATPKPLLEFSRMVRGFAPAHVAPEWIAPEIRKQDDLAHLKYALAGVRFPFHSRSQEATWNSLTGGRLLWNIEGLQLEAMRLGREVRFPYLDRRLVEFVLGLSPIDRLPRGWNKRLLREAASPEVPREVAWRRESTTYESHVVHQGRANLPTIRRILLEGEWRSEPYVVREEAKRILNSVESGEADPYPWDTFRTLWAIAKLEDWLRTGGEFFHGDR